ncbi:MAG: DNA polymerase IV [Asgard group archaeon]
MSLLSRVVMLVDLDYFFAQCEEVRNPSIKDKPVVVCHHTGRSENSGVACTTNYIAREFDVKSGTTITTARKLLRHKNAIFLEADYGLYRRVSKNVRRILEKYADHFEPFGVDEAYLDVTKKVQGSFEQAKTLGQKIKDEIKEKENLSCSIGIGPNKLIAKIASEQEKPDGLTVVKPCEVESFLFPLPVKRLFGVGRRTEKKLIHLGITKIGDLAKYDLQKLKFIFGNKPGTYLHNAAWGIDNSPVEQVEIIKSIGNSYTLKTNTRDLEVILEKASKLCEKVHKRLLKKDFLYRTVGISVSTTRMEFITRAKTVKNASNNLEVFKKTVKELLEKTMDEFESKVRRVGVRLSNLVKEEKKQKQLIQFLEVLPRQRSCEQAKVDDEGRRHVFRRYKEAFK